MPKRPQIVIPTALIGFAAALLSIASAAVVVLAVGSPFGWGSGPAEAAANAIDLAALDMVGGDAAGNTVATTPPGDVEVTALGTIEDCVEVTHPATFTVDFVVQGYPPANNPLVAYDVTVDFPAGLQLTDTFSGDVAPSVLGRTLLSGDPQSGSFFAVVDTPNYGSGSPLVGPNSHSASIVDFAPASGDEAVDGEENSDGFLIRYTFATTGTATGLLSLTLSSNSFLVSDDVGQVPITAVQDGAVAVDTACGTPPTAVNDSDTVLEDSGANAIDVLSNDDDGGAPPLTIIAVTQGSDGTVAITGGGSGLTYEPDANFFGSDTFTYTIQNAASGTDTATVNVTVTGAPDAPVAADVDIGFVQVNSSGNAWSPTVSDGDGDALTCSIVSQPTNGTATAPSGDCSQPGSQGSYSPDAGFEGSDSFTYNANDGNADSNTATVSVEVVVATPTPTATPSGSPTASPTGSPTASPTGSPTAASPTATPTTLPGTGRLSGDDNSGSVFAAIGLVLLTAAAGATGVGIVLRRRAIRDR